MSPRKSQSRKKKKTSTSEPKAVQLTGVGHPLKAQLKYYETLRAVDAIHIKQKHCERTYRVGDDVIVNHKGDRDISQPEAKSASTRVSKSESSSSESDGFDSDIVCVIASKWLARIIDIRIEIGENDKRTAWLLVHWYYSGADIIEKGYNAENVFPAQFAPNERVLSYQAQLLTWPMISDRAFVAEYSEDDLNPPEIDETTFYMRYRYYVPIMEYKLTGKYVTEGRLWPDPERCKFCGNCYNPFLRLNPRLTSESNHSESEPDVNDAMTFCPKPSCRKWYHSSCLLRYMEEHPDTTPTIGTPCIQRLACDPDSDEPYDAFERFTQAIPTYGKDSSLVPDKDQPWEPLIRQLKEVLPSTLVGMAMKSIMRCPGMGSFSVCGNIRDVVLARRMVYQVLDGHAEEQIEVLEALIKKAEDEDRLQKFSDAYVDVDTMSEDRDEEGNEEHAQGTVEGPGDSHSEKAWKEVIDTMNSIRPLASPFPRYWQGLKERELPRKEKLVRCLNCGVVI
ncbi:hypothetical protein K474DRAFT_974178 [Panus rudis PR-1116 ss-1]|nr:hypothetical protein K474DRAFT_974178 [Panus rudis PR-1116 ss-1]